MATCPTCGTQEVPGQQFCQFVRRTHVERVRESRAPAHVPDRRRRSVGYTLAGLSGSGSSAISSTTSCSPSPFRLDPGVGPRGLHHGRDHRDALSFVYNSVFIGFVHGQTLGMRSGLDQVASTKTVTPKLTTPARPSERSPTACCSSSETSTTPPLQPPDDAPDSSRGPRSVDLSSCSRIPFLVDLLWVAWDQRNQTLHDKFAHTIVISTK